MNKRDKAILDDLIRFRVMSRDDIIDLHFPNLKNPINSCNMVMKRLARDGHITCNQNTRPYLYFHHESNIKKDSAKIKHYLTILSMYKEMCKIETPSKFIVEPKYTKGLAEPDVLVIWQKVVFFLEVQITPISSKAIEEKVFKYEEMFTKKELDNEIWQPVNKTFPPVIFITPFKFSFNSINVKFQQYENIHELNTAIKKQINDQSAKKFGIQIKL